MEPWLIAVIIGAGVLLLAVLTVTIILVARLLRLWSDVRDPAMPVSGKIAFWGALAYGIFPIDLLPDPIYLDDAGVVLAAIMYISKLAREYRTGGRRTPGALGDTSAISADHAMFRPSDSPPSR